MKPTSCMYDSEKLDKIVDAVHTQNVDLSELKVITKQNSEILHAHAQLLTKLAENSTKNTIDLEYHIKRTNILESYVTKMIYVLVGLAGAASVQFGPSLFKLITSML